MLTLDTSAVLALADAKDPDHRRVRDEFDSDGGPYVVPAAILCEAGYLLARRYRAAALDAFLESLEKAELSIDCGDNDFTRVRALLKRYKDLRLGFADAAVIACAERNGGKVLTLDVRDFGVVAREGTIAVLPG